jgi:hypothetical protein
LFNPLLEQEKQELEKLTKDAKETVIRAAQTQQIHGILTNNNISLQANKN